MSAALLRHDWTGPAETLAWLTRAPGPEAAGMAGSIAPKLRDVRTLVDLILHNRALWLISRNSDGTIYDAAHLPAEAWNFDQANQLIIGGTVANPREYIYFPGAKPLPFLESAKESLSHYKDMTNTIKSRGRNPMPIIELELTEDYDGLEPGDEGYDEDYDQALQAQKSYGAARRSEDGAVTVTPRGIKAHFHQVDDDGHMLIEARNAVRLDMGNHLNINSELLDGDNGSSDTYSNSLQNRGDFQDLTLPLFFDPITQRLSMDDITPTGETVELKPRPALEAASASSAVGNTGAGVIPDTQENNS